MSCWVNFVGSILALLAISCVLLYPINRVFPDRDAALKPSGILQERMSSTRWAEEHDHKLTLGSEPSGMSFWWKNVYSIVLESCLTGGGTARRMRWCKLQKG